MAFCLEKEGISGMSMVAKKYQIFIESMLVFFMMLFFCMVLFGYKKIWPFGEETIIWADMTHTVPCSYYLYDVFGGKDSFLFSWRYGTGIEMLGIVAQQGMLSPVNLILRLFNRQNVFGAIGILLIVKIALMSGTMYFYLSKFKVKKVYKVMGAVSYATGMSILVQNPIVMTLDIGILFPLLIWAFEEGVNNRRKYWYPILLGICLMINLYMSIMIIFYIIISAGMILLITESRQSRQAKAFYIIVSSLEGMAFSAIIWFPVLMNFMSSSRLETEFVKAYILAIKTYGYMDQIWLVILNLTAFIGLIIYNLKKEILYNKDIVYYGGKFVLLFLAVFVPAIEILWHLGSHSGWAWRFCFIFQFSVIDFAVSLEEKHGISHFAENLLKSKLPVKIVAGGAVLTGILISYFIYNKYTEFSVIHRAVLYSGCILLILYILIYKIIEKDWAFGRICIIVMFFVEITINCVIWISPCWRDRQDKEDIGYLYAAAEIENKIEKNENKWMRTKDYDGNFASNYATVMDVNSIANWIHLIKSDRQNTLKNLGYSVNYTRLLDNGGTVFSDIILGYRSAFSKRGIDSKAWMLSENIASINWYFAKYEAPFVMMIDPVLLSETQNSDEQNVFCNQNTMFYALTGINEPLLTEVKIDCSILEKGIDITFEDDKELYIWMDDVEQFSIIIDGEYSDIQNLNDNTNRMYPVAYNNGIFDLGFFADGENCNIRLEKEGKGVDLEKCHIAVMDYKTLERGISVLNSKQFNYELEFKNTGVDIIMQNIKEVDTYFLLPVLYDEGWSCLINGVEVEKVNIGGFLCFPGISENMDVKLRYYPEGIKMGIILCMILQFLVCFLLALYKKRRVIIVHGAEYLAIVSVMLFIAVIWADWCNNRKEHPKDAAM